MLAKLKLLGDKHSKDSARSAAGEDDASSLPSSHGTSKTGGTAARPSGCRNSSITIHLLKDNKPTGETVTVRAASVITSRTFTERSYARTRALLADVRVRQCRELADERGRQKHEAERD